jgi:hypothetical protein
LRSGRDGKANAMTRDRYFQWMAIWKWFLTVDRTESLETLYGQLNQMWQEDRAICKPDQLAEYHAAWASRDIDLEKDSEFQQFLWDLDRGFKWVNAL